MTNVLSLRVKGTAQDISAATMQVGQFIEGNGYKKNSSTVSVTHGLEVADGQQILDTEILIPLDKNFTPPEGCTLKSVFKIINAVKIRHEGNPSGLQKTCDELMAYIQQRGYTPITAAYIVTVKDVLRPEDMDQAVMDVYIGLNPNTL